MYKMKIDGKEKENIISRISFSVLRLYITALGTLMSLVTIFIKVENLAGIIL
jgi:hypothetical protein